jgi:hypothetical protein
LWAPNKTPRSKKDKRNRKYKNNILNTYQGHYKWNHKILLEKNYRKSIFQKLQYKINLRNTNHTGNNINNNNINDTIVRFDIDSKPLDVEGIIYAIIHIPTNKIYVGQTIRSAYHRFKQHWNERSKTTHYRNQILHECMKKQQLSNFIVWPLEKISKSVYIQPDGKINKTYFRRYALLREHFWIQQLRSMQPQGFNTIQPLKLRDNSRRSKRASRWSTRNYSIHPTICTDCITFSKEDNTIKVDIHTHEGPMYKARKTLQEWIKIEDDRTLKTTIKSTNINHRLHVRRYIVQETKPIPEFVILDRIYNIINGTINEDYQERVTTNNQRLGNEEANDGFKNFIKIVHSAKVLNNIQLSTVFNLPRIKEKLDPPRICYKQLPPLRTWFVNTTKAAKDAAVPLMPQPNFDCPCTRYFRFQNTDLRDGHVCTTSFDNISNHRIRNMLMMGSKYRNDYSKETIITAVTQGLNQYVSKYSKNKTLAQINNILAWKALVLEEVKTRLQDHEDFPDNIVLEEDRRTLKQLHKIYTISPIDKLSHNLAITCTKYYIYMLNKELNSDAYETTDLTYNTILDNHREFNMKYNYSKVSYILPYLYAIPKMHKKGMRFIAGVSARIQQDNIPPPTAANATNPTNNENRQVVNIHNRSKHEAKCSSTEASTWLSSTLNEVIGVLREKDKNNYTMYNYRRFFIVQKAEEIFSMVKQNREELSTKQPRTFDFTTMYTKLQHQDIISNMTQAIKEVNDYLIRNGKPDKVFDSDKILDHVKFIVNNTFICNNKEYIRRQKIGLPMGTNCAPEIANTVLYVWESKYMDKLYRDNTNNKQAYECHNFTRRYIDDLLCFNAEPPPREAYGNLEYSEQTEEDGSINYLGAKMYKQNGRLHMEVFDKTLEWTFPVIRYPHATSNCPHHQSSGIYIGQLQRYYCICNSFAAFKTATTNLTKHMIKRGHKPEDLAKGWNKYLARNFHNNPEEKRNLRVWFSSMIDYVLHPNQDPPPLIVPTQQQGIQPPLPTLHPTITQAAPNLQPPPVPQQLIHLQEHAPQLVIPNNSQHVAPLPPVPPPLPPVPPHLPPVPPPPTGPPPPVPPPLPPVPPPPTGPPPPEIDLYVEQFFQEMQDEVQRHQENNPPIPPPIPPPPAPPPPPQPPANIVDNNNVQDEGNEEEKEDEEDPELLYTEDLFIRYVEANEVVDEALQDELRTKIMHNLRNRDYNNPAAVVCQHCKQRFIKINRHTAQKCAQVAELRNRVIAALRDL